MFASRTPLSHTRRARRAQPASRAGVAYLAVMGTALIVGVVSLAAVHLARIELRGVEGVRHRAHAQAAARSAIEAALSYLADHPDWRTELESGDEMPDENWARLPGGAEFRWQLLEDDGDFTDDDNETLRLRGIGRFGDAAYVESVLLEPRGTPLDCVEASVYSHGDALVQTWPLSSDQTVASGGNIQTINTYVRGDIETSESFGGYYLPGYSLAQSVPQRRLPHDSAFDYYLSAGTPISINDLEGVPGSPRTLQKCVLGPGINPYGTPNPMGIYVLDCGGADLQISHVRIVGTLVVLNPGSGSILGGDVHWEPAARHLPALLVKGPFQLKLNGYAPYTSLQESTHNVNFNPAGAPYAGQTDGDKSDSYPNLITGLVYVSGTLTVQSGSMTWHRFNGCLLTGKLVQYDGVEVSYDPIFRYHPPPGFAHGSQLRPIPGSWRREAY